jgi:hypothetical protein
MVEVNGNSEAALEWEQVKALIARYIGGPLGAAELAKVAPAANREAVEPALAEAGEAIQYLRAASAPRSRPGKARRFGSTSMAFRMSPSSFRNCTSKGQRWSLVKSSI